LPDISLIQILLLVAVLVIPLGLVMANRLRMDLAALGMATTLGLLQFLGWGMLGPMHSPADAVKAISGFSQPVVLTLFSLFIMTRALDKSGVTRWIARHLVGLGRANESVLIVLFTATTAFLSLFMNNLAAAALVLPSAMEVSRRTSIRPSKLLIPVAYGSLLGGAATYFTTANIIASDLLRSASPPQAPLHILDFTPAGGLIALTGIAFLGLLGRRLLPDRAPLAEQRIARLTGNELEDIYQLGERLWEARLLPGSPLCNVALRQTDFGEKWGVSVAALRRKKDPYTLPDLERVLQAGDSLLLVGRKDKVCPLEQAGLEIQALHPSTHLSTQGINLAEAVLAPHSHVEGQTLREIGFRKRFGASVLALRRLNRSFRTDVGQFALAFGDTFLVVGSEEQIRSVGRSGDFIVIEPNPADQPLQRKPALAASLIILGAIAASIAGAPVYLCMLAGAILTVLLGIIKMEEAYQAIEWQAILLITGMYAVSLAMVQTGAAGLLGKSMLDLVTPLGSLGLAAGAYLLSTLLTQFMGGQVTALITGPVTIAAAIGLGASPQAVAVATAIGCSASFLTPMAHPVNILMIGPGNYKFSDFFKVGWPLTLLSFGMLLLGLKLFWGM
jgi:di/tricarboxylate transporter